MSRFRPAPAPARVPDAPAGGAAAPGASDGAADFQSALRAHQAGRLREAEAGYRQILARDVRDPRHAEALHLLGVVRHQQGQSAAAEDLIRQALAIRESANFLVNLGVVLKQTQRLPEAEAAYRRALELQPETVEAWNNLGLILKEFKRLPEAEAAYRRALALQADYLDAWHNLGLLLQQAGRLPEAEAALLRTLDLYPAYPEAHYNLGNLFQETRRLPEAEAAYCRALDLQPDYAEARNNLGLLFQESSRLVEAEAAYRRTIELKPDCAEARNNLGLLLLSQGRFAEAWPCHEYRYRYAQGVDIGGVRELPYPPWEGQSLLGKSLAIWPEQGFGDYLQFVRYAPLLKARGLARLTLVCAPCLKALLQTVPGVDAVIDQPSAPAHDFWSLPLSLPLHLGTTLATIPAAVPYLRVLPERLARWRARLPAAARRVGLVWKGRATHKNDARRSLPGLASLAPLWAVPGVAFVSLQKWQGEAEAQRPPTEQPIVALGQEIEDFADCAAIIAQLDLVICVDTAVAHLAGGLGKPCWVLLPAVGTDWRWLRERADSPWYPGVMRLFRQPAPGDWSATVAEVGAALCTWAAAQRTWAAADQAGLCDGAASRDPAGPGAAVPAGTTGAVAAEAAATAARFRAALGAHRAGRLAEAAAGYREVLKHDPGHADALHLLGVVEQQNGRPAQAEVLIRQALARQESALYRLNLGILLAKAGRSAEAEAAYRRAIALSPDDVPARRQLGELLRRAGRFAEAEDVYRAAIALRPGDASLVALLGDVLGEAGRALEAEAAYRQALQTNPDEPGAHYNLGLLLLRQGRYREGWPHYEYRHRVFAGGTPALPFPRWQGEPLVGKSLLIWSEQGFGDFIQFIRYAPLLKARGVSRLTLACTAPLMALLGAVDGVDAVVELAATPVADAAIDLATVPAHDFWSFPLSLPLHFGTTLDDVPAALPYLRVLADRAARWHRRLDRRPGRLIVGLAWKGVADHSNDANRSLRDLSVLAPLWQVPGLTFVSLQRGTAEDEARRPPAGQPIDPLGAELADFADTAAVIARLDLVISVDTAVAHLAGALGKPCWVLLPAIGTDWRWLQERTDSPWYPGVLRLFRQASASDWGPTIDAVAAELAAWAVRSTAAPAIADVDLVRQGAIEAHLAGRLADAEAGYRQVLEASPGDVAVRNNLGILLKADHRPAEAEAAYRQALDWAPDYAAAWINLGNLLLQTTRIPEAEAAYRRALQLKPDSVEARNGLRGTQQS